MVTNLQGFPIKSGSVFAKSKDSSEQAFLQDDGSFRILGLQPSATYTISVESNYLMRTLPGTKTITIKKPTAEKPEPDVRGIKINSIEKSGFIDVSGSAFFEGEETTAQLKTLYK